MIIKYAICKRQELCDVYLNRHNEWAFGINNARIFATEKAAIKKMNTFLGIKSGYGSSGVHIESVFV